MTPEEARVARLCFMLGALRFRFLALSTKHEAHRPRLLRQARIAQKLAKGLAK